MGDLYQESGPVTYIPNCIRKSFQECMFLVVLTERDFATREKGFDGFDIPSGEIEIELISVRKLSYPPRSCR